MFLVLVLFSPSVANFCCQLMLQRRVNFRLAGLSWFLISVVSFGAGKTVPGGKQLQGYVHGHV